MLFAPRPRLDERIVELLLQRSSSTAAMLHTELLETLPTLTLQTVYYELAKLERDCIICKLGRHYSLRHSWLRVARGALAMDSAGPSVSLFEERQTRRTWNLRSLGEMHAWWSNVTALLLQEESVHEYYEWIPRAWFHLSSPDLEAQILGTHNSLQVPYFLAVGADSPVDREYLKVRADVPGETKFTDSAPRALQDNYISVLGPYYISIKLDSTLSESIDDWFESTPVCTSLAQKEFSEVAARKADISFTLERNEAKSGELRERFKTIFGHAESPRLKIAI